MNVCRGGNAMVSEPAELRRGPALLLEGFRDPQSLFLNMSRNVWDKGPTSIFIV
jgi:hypothetical protein